MVSIVLVHGLAASRAHWEPLLPYLVEYDCLNFELPGHGLSKALDFNWKNTFSTLASLLPSSGSTIFILHSFAASFLPEIIKLTKRTDRIILLEGIIHIDDSRWTQSLPFDNKYLFENWLKRFKMGRRVALKSQLIKKFDKAHIDQWSKGFTEVNGRALKYYSIQLIGRLNSMEIENALNKNRSLISYVRGEKSTISKSCFKIIKKHMIPLYSVNKSGHFPMIDNPESFYIIIKKIIEEHYLNDY